ncbi:Aminopeptidase N [Hypsibius exemplaris]|uniref:Aminopeptidase N n=1 Tax=Hypsibius exemplaris TaxID=2072580 RepID=A0A9X6N9K1_HYPEX|nr:Aminopeptidase N [Hypsibius exemplaris]
MTSGTRFESKGKDRDDAGGIFGQGQGQGRGKEEGGRPAEHGERPCRCQCHDSKPRSDLDDPLKPGSLRLSRINLNGVLTNQIDPINYELFLKIHLPYDANDTIPEPLTTRGNTVAITLKTPDSNLKSITLHVRHEVPADSKTGHILRFAKDKVTVTKKAERTAVVVDSLEYLTSELAQDNQGLYLSQYMKDGQLRNLIVSQFQAFKARRAFPCFDEPGYRSTFTTTLQYPKRFGMTRTNEDVDPSNPASEVNANGLLWTKTVYKTSARMPVYLNAFLVSDANDFKFHEPIVMAQNYGTSFPAFPVNTIGNAELVAGPNNRRDGRFAAEQGRDMIEALKNWFEQPYTISKLDQAGVPDFSAGAMENWGLVVYREASLLYQPQVSTADQKRGVAAIIGHELAHMIFGNLLTCQWWSDTWLNEGFARFMQYELMYRTKPRWNLQPMFTYWVVREAMSQDAFTTTHALSDPSVETIADINGMFSTITYAKGASILHMIKGLMQETPFFNALKQYVKVNADIPTRPELLMTELDKVYNSASDKLSERLSKWIYQKGYPVVTVSRNYDSANPNDISYTQKRFLLPVAPGSSAPVLNETDTWDVPLTLISGAIKDDLQVALQAANRPCWVSSASGEFNSV